jgi:hypothetical protein
MALGARIPQGGLLLLLLATLGCSIPLAVRRVEDPSSEPRGMRFLVRRPAYEAALRLDESASNPCRFRLLLTQTLDGPAIQYEARGETQLLASTDTTLSFDDAGALSAFSAGETDETKEVVKALAGIATSLAPLPTAKPQLEEPAACDGLPAEARLGDYVAKHRAMVQQLETIRGAIAAKLQAVAAGTTSAQVRSIAALRELETALEAEIAAHRFPLDASRFEILLASRDGQTRPVQKPSGTASGSVWFTITLTPERSP